MKIALGAARGLAYLHDDSSPRVIYRDFKASNILLENDFTPKVSDFGLARTTLDGHKHISPHVMGTFGYRPIEEEFNSPVLPEMQKYLTDEEYSVAVGFYILLRAFDRFAANYNTFPRQFDGAMDEEISRLRTTSVSLLIDLGCNGSTLTKDLINEMCRYGAAELHAVAAYVGGVASQEIIKLITKEFVPMTGTFIFNGIDHKSQLLSL